MTEVQTKEHPILFKGEMVRAILDGRKMVTRRVIKPPRGWYGFEIVSRPGQPETRWPIAIDEHEVQADGLMRCPYGAPGDDLWVREAWYCDDYRLETGPYEEVPGARDLLYYRATDLAPDGQCYTGFALETMDCPWKPSIHMPRWASRIQLEVTGVRVERVQGITEEDARAEGVTPFPNDPEGDCWTDGTYRTAFQYLWNEIHGWHPNAWRRNDWVWAISFKRIRP